MYSTLGLSASDSRFFRGTFIASDRLCRRKGRRAFPPTLRTSAFSLVPGALLNRTMTFIFWLLRACRYSRRTLALILRSRRSDGFPLPLLAPLASLLAAHPSATATATATTLKRP